MRTTAPRSTAAPAYGGRSDARKSRKPHTGSAEQNMKKLRSTSEGTETVQRVGSTHGQTHVPEPSDHSKPRGKHCYRCGATDHLANSCRFKDATCHKCKKRGHIARVCRSGGNRGKQQGAGATHNVQDTSPSSYPEEHFIIFQVTEPQPHSRQPIIVLKKYTFVTDCNFATNILPCTH